MAGVFQNLRHIPMTTNLVRLASRVGTASTLLHNRRYSSKNSGGTLTSSSPFSHSVILLQDGLNIEELPIVVRKVSDTLVELQKSHSMGRPSQQDGTEEPTFKDCNSLSSVLSKLGELKTEDVTAGMAYQALEKISEMARNVEYRNLGCVQLSRDLEDKAGGLSFTLDAVLQQLGNIIIKQGTSEQIVASLKLVVYPSFPGRVEPLQKMLAEDCLNRILDNRCSISQVCQVIKLFTFIQQQGWADKSWVGLIGRKLDAANIVQIFNILPYLKESQRAVFNHVERLLSDYINQLPVENVLQILSVVSATKLPSRRTSLQIAYWMGMNLHNVNQEAMKRFLALFDQLNYFDPRIVSAIERFLKAKTSDQELLTAVANYCSKFRVDVPAILNALADGFIATGQKLEPPSIEAIVTTFGLLDYHPVKSFDFWGAVESVLDEKLVQFRPESLLDVLLSCIYLERYPVNFISRIFSPHFLHRLSNQGPEQVESCRQKIKLLDAAMSLECNQYGPSHILPKDSQAKSLRRDGRISRMIQDLTLPLQTYCGSQMFVHGGVILRNLPLSEIYVLDILVAPAEEAIYFRYGKDRTFYNRSTVAILIHPPDHYVGKDKKLIGPQAMKSRHLRLLGFNVVHFAWEDVVRVARKEHLHSFFDCYLRPVLDECRRSSPKQS